MLSSTFVPHCHIHLQAGIHFTELLQHLALDNRMRLAKKSEWNLASTP